MESAKSQLLVLNMLALPKENLLVSVSCVLGKWSETSSSLTVKASARDNLQKARTVSLAKLPRNDLWPFGNLKLPLQLITFNCRLKTRAKSVRQSFILQPSKRLRILVCSPAVYGMLHDQRHLANLLNSELQKLDSWSGGESGGGAENLVWRRWSRIDGNSQHCS